MSRPLTPDARTFEVSHYYADDDPTGTQSDTYSIRVTVTDDDTGSAELTRDLTIHNVPPVLGIGAAPPIGEGSRFELPRAAFTDIGRIDTHRATINWGDGQVTDGSITEAGGAGVVRAEHVFRQDGEFTISLTLGDDDGGTATATVPVVVENRPPVIERLSAVAGSGSTLSFVAIVSDPGNDPLTYTWSFSDGSDSMSGVGLSAIAHSFPNPGTYTVQLTVEDDRHESSSQSMTVVLTNVAAQVLLSGPQQIDEGASYCADARSPGDPRFSAHRRVPRRLGRRGI